MAKRFRNLSDLCDRSCSRFGPRPLFGVRRNGTWQWTTYQEFHTLVERARAGLAQLGIGRGDRVAFIGKNGVEWAAAAHATYGLEAAFVPMYEVQRADERRFILRDSSVKLVVVANDAVADTVASPHLPDLEHVIGLERPAEDPTSWLALLEAGARCPLPSGSPEPSSIANVIYTPGTTGKPKGVLLSHDNLTSNLCGLHEVFRFEPDDRSLSFVPWASAYGQLELHGLLGMGSSIALNDGFEALLDDLMAVQPTVLVATPRLFNTIYEAVNREIGEQLGFVQTIIRTGIRGAVKRAHGERLGPIERLDLAASEAFVFEKIRARLGGRLEYAISASAFMDREVSELIEALGVSVYEGYGLTEASSIVTASCPGRRRPGSVGRPLAGVRVVIDHGCAGDATQEGEIVVYGPNVMVGYHRRPEEDQKALTRHHGLRTGDLGHLDGDGYLYVTGRIDEYYELASGKRVTPAPLEEELKLSPYIANAILCGAGQPFNIALLVIDERAIRAWAERLGLTLGLELTDDEYVRDLMSEELALHSRGWKPFARPRAFTLLRDDFTIESGLLTPTLKLRRRVVAARYGALLDQLHGRRRAPTHASPW